MPRRRPPALGVFILVALVLIGSWRLEMRSRQSRVNLGGTEAGLMGVPSGRPAELSPQGGFLEKPVERSAQSMAGVSPKTQNLGTSEAAGHDGAFGESPATVMDVIRLPILSERVSHQLKTWAWIGGGFRPPGFPGFDEAFRKRSVIYHETYSGKGYRDGIYHGLFGVTANGPQIHFWIRLKNIDAGRTPALAAEWVQWQGAMSRVDLRSFDSPFFAQDLFFKVLHLPGDFLSKQMELPKDCQEITVLPHLDHAESGEAAIQIFNARAYCRRSKTQLDFLGRFAFRWALH